MIIAIIKLATSILVTNPLVYINNMMTLEGTIKCREMYKSEMGKVKILSQMVISLVFYLQRKIVIPSESTVRSISSPQKTDVQVQRYDFGKKNFETSVIYRLNSEKFQIFHFQA